MDYSKWDKLQASLSDEEEAEEEEEEEARAAAPMVRKLQPGSRVTFGGGRAVTIEEPQAPPPTLAQLAAALMYMSVCIQAFFFIYLFSTLVNRFAASFVRACACACARVPPIAAAVRGRGRGGTPSARTSKPFC
eukprot:TRINITY_DN2282_c0_g1_i4.p1 TRINITY_DN2282_c0_g1~~TRINITY_DN2282_c0_g1_i4.p1  ORF type:complete len:134 (-),score=32.79 TRINITY_DN2282_c0_g1_i4:110-511(-)